MNVKFSIFFCACLLVLNIDRAKAQATISFSSQGDSIGYGLPGSQIEVYGIIHNLTNKTLQIKAARIINDTPANWSNEFCLSQCYAPSVDSATDTISPNYNKQVYTSWAT